MIHTMIFDLDGTLVQTEKLKALSYARAANRLRPELDEAEVVGAFASVVGLSRREVARHLVDRFDLTDAAAARMVELEAETPWQAYVQIRLQIYSDMLHDDQTLLAHQWPHTMALLERARASCRKVGLATMSHCPQVRHVLGVLRLSDAFDFVASRDDVEHGKPDPEIYRLVAHELQSVPSACLVIEDSPAGVQAALAAGMACIAVATPFTRKRLRENGLIEDRWIVDDPDDLTAVVDQMLEQRRSA
jgi:HAD superfamily hydrolase (TIGR01509 family)